VSARRALRSQLQPGVTGLGSVDLVPAIVDLVAANGVVQAWWPDVTGAILAEHTEQVGGGNAIAPAAGVFEE